MGAMFAARLARAGNEVSALDASEPVVAALEARGVELVEGGEATRTELRATTDPGVLAHAEVVFVFVKAQHTASVAEAVGKHAPAEATVVSLQNGWGNASVLARHVEPRRLVTGVTYHSCTVREPGSVLHSGSGPTFVGPYQPGDDLIRAEEVAGLLERAGIETSARGDVRTEIWNKLVLNVATLPVAALTRLRAGELAAGEEQLELVDGLAAEAVAVAVALGIPVRLDERVERIHAVLAGAGAGKPSMLQDVEAERKTEIETICGAIVDEAGELAVPVPLNRAMVQLVHGLERSWQR